MRDHGTTRRFVLGATDNWLSRGYLSVCAGLLIWVAADALFMSGNDPSFAGVWPVFATLPTSLLVMAVAAGAAGLLPSAAALPLFLFMLAGAAFVNAALLGVLLRSIRRRTPHV